MWFSDLLIFVKNLVIQTCFSDIEKQFALKLVILEKNVAILNYFGNIKFQMHWCSKKSSC